MVYTNFDFVKKKVIKIKHTHTRTHTHSDIHNQAFYADKNNLKKIYIFLRTMQVVILVK